MGIAPCMKCDKVGCGSYHDECPQYLEFKKEQEKEYEKRIVSSNLVNMEIKAKRRRSSTFISENSPIKRRKG